MRNRKMTESKEYQLTEENYYQDTLFLSKSRFSEYMKCEARQLAIDHGLWEDNKNDNKALVIGNYIHSAFESQEAHERFVADNEDSILTKNKKGKLADFKTADSVIESLKNDDVFLTLYDGEKGDSVEKELIVTGELAGVPFKGKIDTINHSQGYFVDLKTMKSVRGKEWSNTLGQYTANVIANIFDYGYALQMYIYHELLLQQEGDFFTPYIFAVSKQECPDKELVLFDDKTLKYGEEVFNKHIGRVKDVIAGKVLPRHCGKCPYCVEHRVITRAKTIDEIMSEFSA